jgi:chaperonin GroEL
MRLVSAETFNFCGDASKLSVLLAVSMLEHGQEAIDRGYVPRDVVQGMERAVEKAVGHLTSSARPVVEKDVFQVALTATGGDRPIAELVIEAIKKVGKDGVITDDITKSASQRAE